MKSLDGIKPFEKKVWLSSPTMHGEELKFMQEAFESNWMSTVGKNINEVERIVAEQVGCQYAVALFTVRSTPLRAHPKPSRPLPEAFAKDPDAGVLCILQRRRRLS